MSRVAADASMRLTRRELRQIKRYTVLILVIGVVAIAFGLWMTVAICFVVLGLYYFFLTR